MVLSNLQAERGSMIKSMTGFGFSRRETELFSLLLEVKAVNGRHLNITAKLPKHEGHLEFERSVTALLKKHFRRGSFEIYLSFHQSDGGHTSLKLNHTLLSEYTRVLEELRLHFNIEKSLCMGDLLVLNDIFISETVRFSYHENISLLEEMAEEAFAAVEAMRRHEGESLILFFKERLSVLDELLVSLIKQRQECVKSMEERLRKRISALLDDAVADENRLMQEVVFLIDKSDIQEEVARIRSHIDHFSGFLEASQTGKKMEFLLQEINREVNTIGSKSSDARTASLVVEMKSVVEGMREQVLNIE